MIQTTSPQNNPQNSPSPSHSNLNPNSSSVHILIPEGSWQPYIRLGRKRVKISYGTTQVTLVEADIYYVRDKIIQAGSLEFLETNENADLKEQQSRMTLGGVI